MVGVTAAPTGKGLVILGILFRGPGRVYGKWNRIDTGIALAHLYVANKDSFKFYMKDNPEEHKGLFYAGSFEI